MWHSRERHIHNAMREPRGRRIAYLIDIARLSLITPPRGRITPPPTRVRFSTAVGTPGKKQNAITKIFRRPFPLYTPAAILKPQRLSWLAERKIASGSYSAGRRTQFCADLSAWRCPNFGESCPHFCGHLLSCQAHVRVTPRPNPLLDFACSSIRCHRIAIRPEPAGDC
jgi:hypothetical protein